MSDPLKPEVRGFETETKQLLHLVTHALYSNKEVFLRELVSNAVDAIDKLRFEALANDKLYGDDPELKIKIDFDKSAQTITITDNGIGMSRDDVVSHLGTIAKSGTKEFLSKLSGDQAKDSKLIGQFGVGFYSAFIVSDKVTVISRRAGLAEKEAVRWDSDGGGEYTIVSLEKPSRGTKIILHLKKEESEFLDGMRLRNVVTKYSDYVDVPITMKKAVEAKEGEEKKAPEWEQVNRAKALWTLSKSEIKDEEFKEFYKYVSNDYENPALWSLNKVEGKQEYTSLLYIPAKAPFDLWDRDHVRGLKLYVRRVFIMDDAEQFLPLYLRFVKGLVDSKDLPLNVSREVLQTNKTVENIKSGIVKRALSMLEGMANNDAEKYQTFWDAFGKVLKEAPAEDFINRERVAKLFRFASTHNDTDKQDVSFADYIARMKEGQEHIYYITGDSHIAVKNSPHLEVFAKKGIEVLLLSDNVDEWFASHLTEFEGKSLKSVTKGDLNLGDLDDEDTKKAKEKEAGEFKNMLTQAQEALGAKVKEVRITHRLTDSPACLVVSDDEMSANLQRIMQAAGQQTFASQPILELNPKHTLIQRLHNESDDERFKDWTKILFDQALLAEGGKLDDPAAYVKRLNKMLLELAQ